MRLRSGWLWLALLLAFSPTLAGIVSDLGLAPRHRFVLAVGAGLAALCLRERRAAPRPGRPLGLALLGVGLLLELVGLAGETQLLARLGVPLAALGLGLWLGAPGPLPLCLGFWLVPLPNSLVELTSPGLESAWAAAAAALCGAAGVEIQAAGVTLQGAVERLDLRSENGGLLSAHALGALGWFLALVRGGGGRRALQLSALGYALGFALQPVALVAAALLVAAEQRELARAWLTHGQWLLAGALWCAWSARGAARRAAPPPGSRAPTGRPITQA